MATAAEITHGTYTFTRYERTVLPLDGFVFWVKSGLVVGTTLTTTQVRGALHYATTMNQDDDRTYASDVVTFNTMQEVVDLNFDSPATMWVGDFPQLGRYAFHHQDNFFKQAGEHHYIGRGLFSSTETQLIDSLADLDQAQVVSNSLPAWLSLNDYHPFYGFGNDIPIFPAGLVPANLAPPYISINVYPDGTRALGAAPFLDLYSSHTQLARDLVKVTFYGVRNDQAQDFMDCFFQYSVDYDVVGVMNMPIVRDEREKQEDFLILAQKKSAEFEISYYQSRMNDIARQLIETVIITYVNSENLEFASEYVTETGATYYVTEDS